MNEDLLEPIQFNQAVASSTYVDTSIDKTKIYDSAEQAIKTVDTSEAEQTNTVTGEDTTYFNNDSVYNFVSEVSPVGSNASKSNSFTTLSNKTKRFNVARSNTFLTTVDVWNGSSYSNVIDSEYIKTCKAPLVEIKENGEVPMGLYNIDLSTVSKSGKTVSIEVHEDDNRAVIKSLIRGITNYQKTSNQNSGVYSSIKKSFWKVHHKIFNYKGDLVLQGHYICTPNFNIDDVMGYEGIKAVNYVVDFKVVNYHIFDDEGNTLI